VQGVPLGGITQLAISDAGDIAYAAVSPCKTRRAVADVPGCTVALTTDGGRTWADRYTGLPLTITSIDALWAAPNNARTAYVRVTNTDGSQALYGTTDAGSTWTLRSNLATDVLAVDPLDPASLWVGGLALQHSADGGRTWNPPAGAPLSVTAVDVQHRPGAQRVITVSQYAQTQQSRDDGRSWVTMTLDGQPSGGMTSFAHFDDGTLAGVNVMPRDASIYHPQSGWRVDASGPQRLGLARADRADRPSFYFRDDPDEIAVYTPGDGAAVDSPSVPPAERPGLKSNGCYEGPGKVDPSQAGMPVEPARGDVTIYVTSFTSGCLIAYDRWGNARNMFQGPLNTEGIALGFDGQLAIGTRYTNSIIRSRFPETQAFDRIGNVPMAEGPSFDRHGNLYVVDNSKNIVYELPYPQAAIPVPSGQAGKAAPNTAKAVYRFGEGEFLEDTRIAPDTSPFSGSLLVEYVKAGHPTVEGGCTAIAMLTRRGTSWTRRDFAVLPTGFESLGMAFMPDGSLLVPGQKGNILRFAKDGSSYTTFADIGPSYPLVKIDVTADGDVYATSSNLWATGVPLTGLSAGMSGRFHEAVVRFDRNGRRLLPDFTANLSGGVGISVPNVITGHPLQLPPSPVPPATVVVPKGVGAPPQQPPPPPPPVAGVAPAAVPAPGPVAQPQPNPLSQANPVSQGVSQPMAIVAPQRQQQAQLALVLAADAIDTAENGIQPMSAPRQRHTPTQPADAVWLLGACIVAALSRACRHQWGGRP
jgi:photosystem II stability/assembly factor-like uncharacterized protein